MVQVNAYARLQERPVVGALRVADQELVELLGDEELDLDARQRGVRQCRHEGLVGDEVGACDRHVRARRGDHVDKGAQVRRTLVCGARRDDLHRRGLLLLALSRFLSGGRGENLGREDLLAGVVPVDRKDRLDLRDDGAPDGHARVVVVHAGLLIRGGVIVGGHEVVRPDVGLAPVDDQNLAVVAQVGATDLAAQRRKRQHLVPLDAHRVQAATEVPVSGDRAHAVVVDEQADGDAAGDGAFKGLVERGRVLVPGRLVVEGVHVVGGRVDAGGHGSEGFGRVVVEAADAPRRGRESAQVSGQAHDRCRVAVRAVR